MSQLEAFEKAQDRRDAATALIAGKPGAVHVEAQRQ